MENRRGSNNVVSNIGAIERLPINAIKLPQSFKRIGHSEIARAARFIEAFGLRVPLLVDVEDGLVAGEIWLLAARRLELADVPIVRVEGLSPSQIKAYRIGVERIPEISKWDETALTAAFQEWTLEEPDFDLDLTGFSPAEIDGLLAASEEQGADDNLDAADGEAVTVVGDLWRLGRHKILCADATKLSAYEALLGNERAAVVITDPPYNVPIEGHVSGKGRVKHREFAMASGEMSKEQFTNFLITSLSPLAQFSVAGSLHYVFMDWRHASEVLKAGESIFDELKNICVWRKSNFGMGTLYRSQHELVFVFKKAGAQHQNNIQLGRHGRNRSNVWDYAGTNSFDGRVTDEGNLASAHPTVKPVQMIADAILDSSKRGQIVLDGFLGSGSSLIAAERTGRRLYGLEIEPAFVDFAVRRWQRHTGMDAINNSTGKTFQETMVERNEAAVIEVVTENELLDGH